MKDLVCFEVADLEAERARLIEIDEPAVRLEVLMVGQMCRDALTVAVASASPQNMYSASMASEEDCYRSVSTSATATART